MFSVFMCVCLFVQFSRFFCSFRHEVSPLKIQPRWETEKPTFGKAVGSEGTSLLLTLLLVFQTSICLDGQSTLNVDLADFGIYSDDLYRFLPFFAN